VVFDRSIDAVHVLGLDSTHPIQVGSSYRVVSSIGPPLWQRALNTRQYDRTIKAPNGKKVMEHVIPQLAVELRADSIRLLDRSTSNGAQSGLRWTPSFGQKIGRP
jgi:hypothetical protein